MVNVYFQREGGGLKKYVLYTWENGGQLWMTLRQEAKKNGEILRILKSAHF